MRTKNASSLRSLIARPIIKLIVGIGIMLIARYVVASLPVIRNAKIPIPNFPFQPLELALLVIDTIMVVIVIGFGGSMGNALSAGINRFPEIGSIFHMVVILCALLLAYRIYTPLSSRFIPQDIRWLYPLGFIVIAIFPVYNIVMTIYRKIDAMTTVPEVQNSSENLKVARKVRSKATNSCPSCGAKVPEGWQFCPECGEAISEPAKPVQRVKTEVKEDVVRQCPNCGSAVEDDAKFCEECGSRL